MPRTGFLPEPIPTADVEPRRLEAEIEALKTFAVSRSPNVTSRLFKSVKKDAFLRSCKGLNVEQALATYPTILKSGLDASTVRITMADVRALAEKIGNDATPGIVEEALADTRLFRDWVKAVAKRIAKVDAYPKLHPTVFWQFSILVLEFLLDLDRAFHPIHHTGKLS